MFRYNDDWINRLAQAAYDESRRRPFDKRLRGCPWAAIDEGARVVQRAVVRRVLDEAKWSECAEGCTNNGRPYCHCQCCGGPGPLDNQGYCEPCVNKVEMGTA